MTQPFAINQSIFHVQTFKPRSYELIMTCRIFSYIVIRLETYAIEEIFINRNYLRHAEISFRTGP